MNSIWKKSTFALTVVLGLCLADAGYGIVRHDGADDQDYIDYGNLFDSTVWLGAEDSEGFYHWQGSAVVIDDGHWVLCSGHQLFNSSRQPEYVQAYIGNGSQVGVDSGDLFFADEWWCHPGYSRPISSPDIALLYFENPILDVEPAQRYRGSLTKGQSVSIVGYGRPGTPNTGYLAADRQRRGCENIFDRFGTTALVPTYAIISKLWPEGSSDYNPLGGLVAPGDSGGGWYDEDGYLIGITSGTSGDEYYDRSIGMDITRFNSWIDGIQATVPEPSAFVLLFLAAVAVLPVRVRRKTA